MLRRENKRIIKILLILVVFVFGLFGLAAFAQENQIPVAVAQADKTTALVGETISFSSAGSHDLDGTIILYQWEFGSGEFSNDPNPSYSYSEPGTYLVSLTVWDNWEYSATDTIYITVESLPPPIEEPPVEEPVEEPFVEEPFVEEPVEEPFVEEPVVEEPVVGEPLSEEFPEEQEPIAEETEQEASLEEPAEEEFKQDSTEEKPLKKDDLPLFWISLGIIGAVGFLGTLITILFVLLYLEEKDKEKEKKPDSRKPAAFNEKEAVFFVAEGPCSQIKKKADDLKQGIGNKMNSIQDLLERIVSSAKAFSQVKKEQGKTGSDLSFSEGKLKKAEKDLQEHDHQLEGLKESYQESIEAFRKKQDYQTVLRLEKGVQQMEKRYKEKRKPKEKLLKESQGYFSQCQKAYQKAENNLNSKRLDFESKIEELRNFLAGFNDLKDNLMKLLINRYECFNCNKDFMPILKSFAKYLDLFNTLSSLLEAEIKAVEKQLADVKLDFDKHQGALESHNADIEEIKKNQDDLIKRMKGALDGYMVSGFGQDEKSGPSSIGLLPGSSIRLHFSNNRIDMVLDFLRDKVIGEIRSGYSKSRKQLEEKNSQTLELKLERDRASADFEAKDIHNNSLNQALDILSQAGNKENLREKIKELGKTQKECLKKLPDCIIKRDGLRSKYLEKAAELRAKIKDLEYLLGRSKQEAERMRGLRDRAASVFEQENNEELDKKLSETENEINEITNRLNKAVERAKGFAGLGEFPCPESLSECESQISEIYALMRDLEHKISNAKESSDQARQNLDGAGSQMDRLRRFANDWERYKRDLQDYKDCLKAKKEAIEKLKKLYENDKDYRKMLDEMGKVIDEGGKALDKLEKLGKAGEVSKFFEGTSETIDKIRKTSPLKKLEKFSEQLDRIEKLKKLQGKLSVLNKVAKGILDLSSDTKNDPEKSLEAIKNLFDLGVELMPDFGGANVIKKFFDFYSKAMGAIAKALGKIKKRQIAVWEASGLDPEMAPISIREDLKRALETRQLFEAISKDCSQIPAPPELVVQ